EEHAFDALPVRGIEHEHLDQRVVPDEIRRPGVVGQDPADLCGREEDELGPFRREAPLGLALPVQVELAAIRQEPGLEPGITWPPHDRGPYEAAVRREVDPALRPHRPERKRSHQNEAAPRAATTCPASRSVRSCRASSMSCATIMRTSSANVTSGAQPSFERALDASPSRWSTSVGRM